MARRSQGRSGSHPAPPAWPCPAPARNSWAAGLHRDNAGPRAGSTGWHRGLWPGTGAFPRRKPGFRSDSVSATSVALGKLFPGPLQGFSRLHNEEIGLASGEGLSSLCILVSGLLEVYLSRAVGGPQRGGSHSGEVWKIWVGWARTRMGGDAVPPPDISGAVVLRAPSLPSPWPLLVFPCLRQTDWEGQTQGPQPCLRESPGAAAYYLSQTSKSRGLLFQRGVGSM